MNNQQYNQPEAEINLKEVMWDLLEQWKAILLVSVAVAILVTGVKYFTDMNKYRDTIAEQKAQTEEAYETLDEHITAILSELSENDQSAVQLLIQQEAWLNNQVDYFNNSLLLKLDPNSQRQLTLSYYLYDAENNAYNTLCDAYINAIKSDNFSDIIKKHIQSKTEDKYIKELINGTYTPNNRDDSSGVILNIVITLADYMDASALEKEISELMAERSKELYQSIDAHNIKFVGSSDIVRVNESAASKRTNTITSINSLSTSISNLEKTLSAEQKAAYDKIALLTERDENQELQEAADQAETIAKPSPSKKYALLGVVLGAMAYAFAYLIWLIIRGRVNYASDVENYTGSRLLAEIYRPLDDSKYNPLLKSRFVDNYRYRGTDDYDKQLEKATTAVLAACRHEKLNAVTNLNLYSGDLGIMKSLEKKDITVDLIDTENISEDSFLNINNAVLTVGRDTKLTELANLDKLCRYYGVNILGSIYVGEM